MNSKEDGWIPIGTKPQQEPLQLAVREIKRKWPGRFDFRITPKKKSTPAEELFQLSLRHR